MDTSRYRPNKQKTAHLAYVKLKIIFDGEEQNYQIVAPTEADILKGKISYHSPLGQNLMGKEAGAEFGFQAAGKMIKVKILEIK